MDSLTLGKVSIGVPSGPSFFTFVPVVQKLPFESIIAEEEEGSGARTGKTNKIAAESHERTSGETMSERNTFKGEIVFIKDAVAGGAGSTIPAETELRLKSSEDHMSLSHTKASPSVSAQPENTPNHTAAVTASMETAVDKHRAVSQRQCHDTSGRAEINKIKLSYKSLAAIPTNTLLLDQQVIDEQVEREESPCDSLDRGAALDRGVADTHAEMCSPAQLRQQSEELYAVIDEVLANSTPASSRSSTPNFGLQNNSTLPKSLGRETKYASLSSLYQSGSVDRKLTDPRKTKPGVIRPMTAIPRLTVQDVEEFRPNPFRQPVVKRTLIDDKKAVNVSPEQAGAHFEKDITMGEERTTERKNPFSVCDLQITEPEDQITQCAKDASAPSSQTEGRMKAFETHI
ncbi:muscular LMNA-interacting protein isoform X6 [Hippoglossus hippoglossus]|uniref:muscular LMNA-interacting protein isoform X6 n=1 Tax=Hippoglossus hippoglossus TaxID=8267 RepID=UPI00148C0E9F|nr:muscular LMNA-interacting protein isoform X6 [Hippoglossus hippoglossus]